MSNTLKTHRSCRRTNNKKYARIKGRKTTIKRRAYSRKPRKHIIQERMRGGDETITYNSDNKMQSEAITKIAHHLLKQIDKSKNENTQQSDEGIRMYVIDSNGDESTEKELTYNTYPFKKRNKTTPWIISFIDKLIIPEPAGNNEEIAVYNEDDDEDRIMRIDYNFYLYYRNELHNYKSSIPADKFIDNTTPVYEYIVVSFNINVLDFSTTVNLKDESKQNGLIHNTLMDDEKFRFVPETFTVHVIQGFASAKVFVNDTIGVENDYKYKKNQFKSDPIKSDPIKSDPRISLVLKLP